MTSPITTEDREAAEKLADILTPLIKPKNDESIIGMMFVRDKIKEAYLVASEMIRKQPDSEFQKGVASVQSQLTEARERLRVACELLESAKGWAITYAMQTYSKVASKEADEIEEFLAQIQEPNGKKGG